MNIKEKPIKEKDPVLRTWDYDCGQCSTQQSAPFRTSDVVYSLPARVEDVPLGGGGFVRISHSGLVHSETWSVCKYCGADNRVADCGIVKHTNPSSMPMNRKQRLMTIVRKERKTHPLLFGTTLTAVNVVMAFCVLWGPIYCFVQAQYFMRILETMPIP